MFKQNDIMLRAFYQFIYINIYLSIRVWYFIQMKKKPNKCRWVNNIKTFWIYILLYVCNRMYRYIFGGFFFFLLLKISLLQWKIKFKSVLINCVVCISQHIQCYFIAVYYRQVEHKHNTFKHTRVLRWNFGLRFEAISS